MPRVIITFAEIDGRTYEREMRAIADEHSCVEIIVIIDDDNVSNLNRYTTAFDGCRVAPTRIEDFLSENASSDNAALNREAPFDSPRHRGHHLYFRHYRAS